MSRARIDVLLRVLLAAFLSWAAISKLLTLPESEARYAAVAYGELVLVLLLIVPSTATLGTVICVGAFFGAAVMGLVLSDPESAWDCKCLGALAVSRAQATVLQGAIVCLGSLVIWVRLSAGRGSAASRRETSRHAPA